MRDLFDSSFLVSCKYHGNKASGKIFFYELYCLFYIIQLIQLDTLYNKLVISNSYIYALLRISNRSANQNTGYENIWCLDRSFY